jgi:hypothetical protein
MSSALRPPVSYVASSQALQSNGLVIFQNSVGALSYHAPVGRDIRKFVSAQRVQGRACQRGFQLPIEPLMATLSGSLPPTAASVSATWGDGGYRAALDQARRGLPRDAVLYDVRADLATFVILSIYRERCIVLDAAVALPLEATATSTTVPTDAPR